VRANGQEGKEGCKEDDQEGKEIEKVTRRGWISSDDLP
jgi:hypothetical protein